MTVRDVAWIALGLVVVWLGWLWSGEPGMVIALLVVGTIGCLIADRRMR